MMALVFATVSCGNEKKSKHHDSDDEELVEDDEDDEDLDEDEDDEDEASDLNDDLLGSWSNNQDPNISMVLSAKMKDFEGKNCYGYIQTYNEYYEPEYTYVFNQIEADGEDIRVTYDQKEMQLTGGDPDNYDSEDAATWEEVSVAFGSFTISPNGKGKCKIASGDKKLNHLVLYKSE